MKVTSLLDKWLVIKAAARDAQITGTDLKLLVFILDCLDNRTGQADLGAGWIAEQLKLGRVNRRMISRAVNKLDERGYLSVSRNRGKSGRNRYALWDTGVPATQNRRQRIDHPSTPRPAVNGVTTSVDRRVAGNPILESRLNIPSGVSRLTANANDAPHGSAEDVMRHGSMLNRQAGRWQCRRRPK